MSNYEDYPVPSEMRTKLLSDLSEIEHVSKANREAFGKLLSEVAMGGTVRIEDLIIEVEIDEQG